MPVLPSTGSRTACCEFLNAGPQPGLCGHARTAQPVLMDCRPSVAWPGSLLVAYLDFNFLGFCRVFITFRLSVELSGGVQKSAKVAETTTTFLCRGSCHRALCIT